MELEDKVVFRDIAQSVQAMAITRKWFQRDTDPFISKSEPKYGDVLGDLAKSWISSLLRNTKF